ncbi:MAG: YjbQ family protein [Actinomycetota bacterium]|nr:YjbQ family protein [Actinomycetota bacterium]
MQTHQTTFTIAARSRLGFVDVTDAVETAVASCDVTDGRVTILRPSAGCALVLNEQEKGLHADVQATLERLGSASGATPPTAGSPSLVLPVVGSRIRLGTWQRILLLELEEPRDRELQIQVVGE